MKETKKVLHIITISFVINHFFGNQFNYLREKTGNKYFLGCSPSKELFELSSKLGYTPFPVEVTRKISPLTDFCSIYKIYRYIKDNDIDIVVGHTPKGGMLAMLAAYFTGVRHRIYFRHGIIYETSTGFQRWLLKSIDRFTGFLATKVVCVSNSVRSISERDKLNAQEKNTVLGLGTCNGINTSTKFNPHIFDPRILSSLRVSLGIEDGDFVVGYVGRLVRDKGINELVQAWMQLSKNYNNIKLLLVGPIEERDSIAPDIQEEIRSNPTIINTGFVPDASPYFKLMNVFVLPTYREGFPTVALEASAMELPVIITRATGCSEAIINDVTGVFVANDAVDICRTLEFYIHNPEIGVTQGSAGRRFVVENFEETKVWDIIEKELGY